MKHIPSNADVWIIHKNHALLFHQREGLWHEEMSLQFNDFVGSAISLSSFTLPDTCVYLNLDITKETPSHPSADSWVAIEKDPLRLVAIQNSQPYQDQLATLLSMGKKVTVIATSNLLHFEHSTAMLQLAPFELKHLATWVSEQKKETRSRFFNMKLLFSLWQKPSAHYQHLRLSSLLCALITAILMQVQFDQQTTKQAAQSIKSIPYSAAKSTPNIVQISMTQWATQLSKFGQGNRANVNTLNIHWDEEGHIQTLANLSKERKRAPKGCVLELPAQAICNTATLAP